MTSSSELHWRSARGSDLEQLLQDGDTFLSEIPEGSGLYLWKRHFRIPYGFENDPAGLMNWIIQLAGAPYGEIRQEQLGRLLRIRSIELSGGTLPQEKIATLRDFLGKPQNRLWIKNYLRLIESHSPPLYIGETESLPERARQHMTGSTNFGAQVRERSDVDWADLDFYWIDLGPGPGSKKTRTLLEYTTASLTLAGYTDRPG